MSQGAWNLASGEINMDPQVQEVSAVALGSYRLKGVMVSGMGSSDFDKGFRE